MADDDQHEPDVGAFDMPQEPRRPETPVRDQIRSRRGGQPKPKRWGRRITLGVLAGAIAANGALCGTEKFAPDFYDQHAPSIVRTVVDAENSAWDNYVVGTFNDVTGKTDLLEQIDRLEDSRDWHASRAERLESSYDAAVDLGREGPIHTVNNELTPFRVPVDGIRGALEEECTDGQLCAYDAESGSVVPVDPTNTDAYQALQAECGETDCPEVDVTQTDAYRSLVGERDAARDRITALEARLAELTAEGEADPSGPATVEDAVVPAPANDGAVDKPEYTKVKCADDYAQDIGVARLAEDGAITFQYRAGGKLHEDIGGALTGDQFVVATYDSNGDGKLTSADEQAWFKLASGVDAGTDVAVSSPAMGAYVAGLADDATPVMALNFVSVDDGVRTNLASVSNGISIMDPAVVDRVDHVTKWNHTDAAVGEIGAGLMEKVQNAYKCPPVTPAPDCNPCRVD